MSLDGRKRDHIMWEEGGGQTCTDRIRHVGVGVVALHRRSHVA